MVAVFLVYLYPWAMPFPLVFFVRLEIMSPWATSHMVGEARHSLTTVLCFPQWEKSWAKRVYLGTELCLLEGRVMCVKKNIKSEIASTVDLIKQNQEYEL